MTPSVRIWLKMRNSRNLHPKTRRIGSGLLQRLRRADARRLRIRVDHTSHCVGVGAQGRRLALPGQRPMARHSRQILSLATTPAGRGWQARERC